MNKFDVGVKVNYLTILKITRLPNGGSKALCRCDCGTIKEFYLSNISPRRGNTRYTKSCGCKKIELVREQVSSHGFSKEKFYRHWTSMKNRTLPTYINANAYEGVKICKRWIKFENFKSDMYESYLDFIKTHKINEATLDRIDPLGDYQPENCRWLSKKEQAYNKKDSIYITYKGETMHIVKMCEKHNVPYTSVYSRLKRGYSVNNAMEFKPWQGNTIKSRGTQKI